MKNQKRGIPDMEIIPPPPPEKKLTKEQHKERHIQLHKAFDELIADYITHHEEEILFTKKPLIKLMEWSYKQTKNPSEL